MYRPEGELDAWIKKDPIPRVEKYLLESDVMTEEEMKKINDDVDKMVEEAIEFARQAPSHHWNQL